MDRPVGSDEPSKRAREKWYGYSTIWLSWRQITMDDALTYQRDAWRGVSGLSRTEAKRRYISTLIETMHKYASPSPDARELVSELEFVWDQVKSNVPSSSSSSPLHTHGGVGLVPLEPPQYPSLNSNTRRETDGEEPPMRVMSPMSQSQEDEAEAEEREEFVDAPDSQTADEPVIISSQVSAAHPGATTSSEPPPQSAPGPVSPSRDPKWRRRMEAAMVRMTAEIAALREQLENRRLFSYSRRYRIMRFLGSMILSVIKHIALDAVILIIVLLWMRRKKDRRLEGAVRVLLGDTVAQVQKVGGKQVAALKMQLGAKGKPN